MVRDEPGDVTAFLHTYADATGDRAALPAFRFGDSAAMADELLGLVLAGRKRATAGLVADYKADGDAPPAPGDRSVVLDGQGRGACVIETVDVRTDPLASVDPAFAWDEGEGDRTREDWLDVHRRFFARRAAALGIAASDELETVFERFTVVWPHPRRPEPVAAEGSVEVWPLRFDEQAWATTVTGRSERLPGLVAHMADRRVGLAVFRPRPGGTAELVSLDVLEPGLGADRLLLIALESVGRVEGWSRLWCDSTEEIACFRECGWELVMGEPRRPELSAATRELGVGRTWLLDYPDGEHR